jgi:hypothetical protein
MLSHIEMVADQFLEAHHQWLVRKQHLETGHLSEDLLPPEILTSILRAKLPSHSRIISPVQWYYQEVKVIPMWNAHQLIFQAVLPVISEVPWRAVHFTSWPVPVKHHYVHLQLPDTILEDTRSNLIALNPACIGTSPLVCYPSAQRLVSQYPCAAKLLLSKPEYSPHCAVQFSTSLGHAMPHHRQFPDTVEGVTLQDRLVHRHFNEYIFITNGTVLTYRCQGLSAERVPVQPGVYHLSLTYPCLVQSQTWTVKSSFTRTTNVTILEQLTMSLPNISFLSAVSNYHQVDFNIDYVPPLEPVQTQHFQLQELEPVRFTSHEYLTWYWYLVIAISLLVILLLACLLLRHMKRRKTHKTKSPDTPLQEIAHKPKPQAETAFSVKRTTVRAKSIPGSRRVSRPHTPDSLSLPPTPPQGTSQPMLYTPLSSFLPPPPPPLSSVHSSTP